MPLVSKTQKDPPFECHSGRATDYVFFKFVERERVTAFAAISYGPEIERSDRPAFRGQITAASTVPPPPGETLSVSHPPSCPACVIRDIRGQISLSDSLAVAASIDQFGTFGIAISGFPINPTKPFVPHAPFGRSRRPNSPLFHPATG